MKNFLVKAILLAVLVCSPVSGVFAEDTQELDIAVESVDAKDENLMIIDEGEDSSVVSIISEEDDDEDMDEDNNEDFDDLYLQAVKNTEPVEIYSYTESIFTDGMPNPISKKWQIITYRKEDLLKNYLIAKQAAEKAQELEQEVAIELVETVAKPTEHVEKQETEIAA